LNTIVEEIRDDLQNDQVHTKVFWGEEGVIAEDILRLAQRRNPDLLVVSGAIDGASKPRFIGPYAQKVINCAKLPILCISNAPVPAYIF
jgi:nucleotide-binding universal stress UspA family protein